MTIFTECPSCDHEATFEEDPSRFGGWFPFACEECGQCMWVQNVIVDGVTYHHADFLELICAPERRAECNREAKKACQGVET